jgi:hypothetical protein
VAATQCGRNDGKGQAGHQCQRAEGSSVSTKCKHYLPIFPTAEQQNSPTHIGNLAIFQLYFLIRCTNSCREQRQNLKGKTLFSYYQKTSVAVEREEQDDNGMTNQDPELDENESEEGPAPTPPKIPRLNSDGSVLIVEHDPGLRRRIWEYPIDEQDQARRIYIMHGPFRFIKESYPYSGPKSHPRCFQSHWFNDFPWLEYSPTKDAAFCCNTLKFHH